jgi:hypothetical protein
MFPEHRYILGLIFLFVQSIFPSLYDEVCLKYDRGWTEGILRPMNMFS